MAGRKAPKAYHTRIVLDIVDFGSDVHGKLPSNFSAACDHGESMGDSALDGLMRDWPGRDVQGLVKVKRLRAKK